MNMKLIALSCRSRAKMAKKCVVPENIHIPTTEGIGNSEGMVGRVVRGPGNSRGEGGWTIKITFQGVNFELCMKIATY